MFLACVAVLLPVVPAVAQDNSAFISQSIPTGVVAGETYPASVVMKNTGTTTWNSDRYSLAQSSGSFADYYWQTASPLQGSEVVAPGQTHLFTLNLVAPSSPGTHSFDASMFRPSTVDYSSSVAFGAVTPPVTISVEAAVPDAAFVSQTIPASLTAGQSYDLWITVKNTGNTTWKPSSGHILAAPDPQDVWGSGAFGTLAYSVPPNYTYTFGVHVTAPSTPGTYNFQRRMQKFQAWFGALTANVAIPVIPSNAAFVSQTVPSPMMTGQTYPVTVVMQNTGSTTWMPGNYTLGSVNSNWGSSRFGVTTAVASGQQYSFSFNVTAPTNPGTYDFRWNMVQEDLGVAFGAASSTVSVVVNRPDATPLSQTVPSSMLVGRSYPVTVVMKNTGTVTWPGDGSFYLGSQNPSDTNRWGVSHLPLSAAVAPGQQYAFSFIVTPPTEVGTANFQWQMAMPQMSFGSSTGNVAVAVALPPKPTITVERTPSPMLAGQTANLSWNSTDATAMSVDCTSSGTGYVASSTLATGGTSSLTVDAAWVGYPTTCTYTATGPGGVGSFLEALNTISDAPASIWRYGYDAMGRVNTVIDPNTQSTYFYHDNLGRTIQLQQPANTGSSTPTLTGFGWDLADSLTLVTDARNLNTSYSADGFGNVKAETSPDRGNSNATFDPKGNLLSGTDARGKTTTYSYDSLDRLKTISYPSGAGTSFEYDGGSTPTPAEVGELTRMTDESGQTIYAHDALGRLTAKTVTIAGRSFAVRYNWGDSGTALDKLTSITYPSGSQVNYSYGVGGVVDAVSVSVVNANGVGVGSTSQALISVITYDADGQVTGWQWSDGKSRLIGYYSSGLVAFYNLGDHQGTGQRAGSFRIVKRDAVGRITGYLHTGNGQAQTTLDQSFAYDNLDRLTSATVGGNATTYSYDATGNRTAKAVGGTSYANTVEATSNRLTQTQDVTGTATLGYDNAGHLTADGANTYTYSDRGRMKSASTPGGVVDFLYNGLEQRVRKSSAAGSSHYVYDEAGNLLGEYDGNGSPLYETIYLGSKPMGLLKQTGSAATNDIAVGLYNVYADHLDTARVITKQDHTIVWRWDTAEAFGATAPDQNPTGQGAFSFNQRLPGQVFDAETGLFQNWNREYNARWGRYAQSDPIGLGGGINTFSYVGGNPLTYVDPDGRLPIIIIPIVAAAIGGTLGGGANYLMQKYWQNKCEVSGLDVANAAFWGALGGAALPASGGTVLGAAGVGATANMGQYFTGQLMNGEAPTARDTAWNAATGAAGGAAGGAFARPITYGAVGTALPLVARDRQTMTTLGANAGVGTTLRNFFGALVGNVPLERPTADCTCRK